MVTRTIAMLALVAMTIPAQGDAQAPLKIYGVGVQSCAWFTPPAGAPIEAAIGASMQRMAALAWVTGYVTGAAAVYAGQGVTLRDTTGTDLEVQLRTYCQAHPDGTIEQASAEIVRTLAKG